MFDVTDTALQFLLECDPLLASAAAADDAPASDGPAGYIGSKRRLVDWIWRHTPDGVSSVLDAFSGSAVVAYMYKKQGLRVVANDRLRFAWHVAATLSDDEIIVILQPNPKAGDFVRRTYWEKYFRKGGLARIDQVRENIEQLKGYKKDIALFALGRTCMNSAGSFGRYRSTAMQIVSPSCPASVITIASR